MSASHSLSTAVFAIIFSLVLTSCFANNCYLEQHAAWGGNGGWWGGGNQSLYEDYAWRTNDDPCAPSCQAVRHHNHPCCPCRYEHPMNGRYCYQSHYVAPQNEYEFNDTVAGAGLYLNLEGHPHCPCR